MNITIVEKEITGLWPLASDGRTGDLVLGGKAWRTLTYERWNEALGVRSDLTLKAQLSFWPSPKLLAQLATCQDTDFVVLDEKKHILAEGRKAPKLNALGMSRRADARRGVKATSIQRHEFVIDDECICVNYPWHLLDIQEQLLSNARHGTINGIIHEGSVIDGNLDLGDGSVILPGVYIQGNVIIGEHCMVGPNCCIRGNTSIGDNCRVGQGAEIKNSIIMPGVKLSHTCYIGDSILASGVDIGAGTMVSNFRHDGSNHFSVVNGKSIDTGRDHFGTVIGENVRTGVNTSIFPGRKIGPGVCTFPGDIVREDLR